MQLSIVSPIYKGEKMLEELVTRIKASVETFTMDYEIILVNDCSPDNSWDKMKDICSRDKKVKGLNLSRNFGQYYAITAGLMESKGEWVTVMDCDLQDRPEEIPNLYNKAQEGYDTVFAQLQATIQIGGSTDVSLFYMPCFHLYGSSKVNGSYCCLSQ